MMEAVESRGVEKAEGFMLAEYTLLKDLRAGALRQGETRQNFYFTAVSAVIAAIALMYDFMGRGSIILLTAAALLGLLLFLGIATFRRIIEVHVSVTRYTRGINLIRRYFVSRHKDLGPYISNPISDSEPGFGNLGFVSSRGAPKISRIGLTGIAMILNSFVAALLVLLFLQSIEEANVAAYGSLGLLVFSSSLVLHEVYLRQAAVSAEEAYREQQSNLRMAIHDSVG